jgi:tetratricopeptide (TPR) repeat protein
MSSTEPRRYHAFLSYNSQDRAAVREVAERLIDEKLKIFVDWELLPGREFQPALAEALHESRTCVVFVGPNDLGWWQKEEVQVAIDKRAREPEFRVIPVLLPGAVRPKRGEVAHLEFLINATWVELVKTLDDDAAFRQLVAGITGIPIRGRNDWYEDGVCPYRGLEAFRPDDEKFFFGRDNLTGWLVGSLRREIRAAQGVRFLGVFGPSGSGKSSVVLAGLVPRLKAGAIEGSEHWPVVIFRPGDDPLKNLATAVVQRFHPADSLPDAAQVLKLIGDLRADARTLDIFAHMSLCDQPGEVRLAVVVDQFEEVFTYRPQDDQARTRFEHDRNQFFANLLQAAAAPGGRVAVVLTMRSDFWSSCAPFPQLNDVLSSHQEQVGPMSASELREAIEQPAFRVGCEVEPALTERLLADVEGQPCSLPLLQFALTEVWKRRNVRELMLRAYNDLGGVEGAIEHRANEIYNSLKPEYQDLCRWLFLRLVQPGEGTEDTKRRASYRELLPGDSTRAEAVKRLIQTLADRDARLITTEGADATDGAVEVAHEALIRGWTQFRRWVDAERAGLRIQRRLTEAAQEWAAASPEHKQDYLYSGARLAVCREWVETRRDELSRIEAALLAASEEAEQERKQDALKNERRLREAAEAVAQQQKVLAAKERQRRKLGMALAAAVLLVVGIVAVSALYWQNLDAQKRAEEALASKHIDGAETKINDRDIAGARELLQPVMGWLGHDAPDELRDKYDKLDAACKLDQKLKSIERQRSTWTRQGRFDNDTALNKYEDVFREAGLDPDRDLEGLAAEIRKHPVASSIQEAIDNWALVCFYQIHFGPADKIPERQQRRDRLLNLARTVDSDKFRDQIRNPEVWDNREALEQLAQAAQTKSSKERLPPRLAALLAELLRLNKWSDRNLEPLLRTYQSHYPDDFWLNFDLAKLLQVKGNRDDALRFYQAALAVEPSHAIVLTKMASVFDEQGNLKEALSHLNRALDISPDNVVVRTNLGTALRKNKQPKDAITQYHLALEINAKDVPALYLLGQSLEAQGDRKGAIQRYQEALEFIPDHPSELGLVFSRIDIPAKKEDLQAAIAKALDNVQTAKPREDEDRK